MTGLYSDDQTIARIGESVRFTEKERGDLTKSRWDEEQSQKVNIKPVEITGAISSGTYPAVVKWFNRESGLWEDRGVCRLKIDAEVDDAVTVSVGQRWLAILQDRTSDGTALYVGFSPAGEFVRWLRVIEATASGSGSTWRCYMQRPTLPPPSTTYTDGVECRLKLIAGETFQNGKYYLGTLNGVTDGKPLFHAAGETIFILNTCDAEGTPICDKWYMHSNFTIVENVDCETGAPL
jgi:hypothetical protein